MANSIKMLTARGALLFLSAFVSLHAADEHFDFELIKEPIKSQSYEGWMQFSNKEKVLRVIG